MLIVLALASMVIGVLGGMSGIGGFLLPPIMIEFLGIGPHVAMAMTQASFIIPSILGVRMYVQSGSMNWRLALPFALAGCVSSFLGAWWAKPKVDGAMLSLLLGVLIVVAGYSLLRPAKVPAMDEPGAAARRIPLWVWTVLGGAIGFLSGMTGSGANAILVPAMIMGGLSPLTVVAACFVFSLLTSVTGTYGNAVNLNLDWPLVGVMTATQLAGTWAGVRLALRLPMGSLKRAIAVLCLVSGVIVVVKNFIAVFSI